MEPYTESPLLQLLRDTRIRRGLIIISIIFVLVSIGLLTLTFVGYGTLQLTNIPPYDSIKLNGHTLQGSNIKLRPGNYQISATSQRTMPFEATVHINLFKTTVVKIDITPRSADAVASSVLGALPGTSSPPVLQNVRYFGDGIWIAGTISPSDTVLVLHYDSTKDQWQAALCNSPGYPNNPTTLPADITTYITPLLAGGV